MKRLDRDTATSIRMAVGACPSCSMFEPAMERLDSVIYRRSHRSVTMRCGTCGLQWTVTWVKLHQAAKRMAAASGDSEFMRRKYESVEKSTEFAVDQETRGRREAA